MKLMKNIQKYAIAVIIGLIIIGCNLFSSQQESEIFFDTNTTDDTSLPDTTAQDTPAQILPTRDPVEWYDNIKFSLLSYEESPRGDGTKTLTFQTVIQNTSQKDWIIIGGPFSNPFSNETITTGEEFNYDRWSYRKCYTKYYNETYGEENERFFNEIDKSRAGISFNALPPGFQTLVCKEEWIISEFSTEPIKNITLNTNKGSADFSIPLSPDEVIPYIETPFVGNISWNEYKNHFDDYVNILDIGQSIEFEFGKFTFMGFHENLNQNNFNYMFLVFDVENASQGYKLDFDRSINGFVVDSSAGFSMNLRSMGNTEVGYFTSVNPGQTATITWSFGRTDDHPNRDTMNFERPFPRNYQSLKNPICAVIPELVWGRDDVGYRTYTEINLVVCQE